LGGSPAAGSNSTDNGVLSEVRDTAFMAKVLPCQRIIPGQNKTMGTIKAIALMEGNRASATGIDHINVIGIVNRTGWLQ